MDGKEQDQKVQESEPARIKIPHTGKKRKEKRISPASFVPCSNGRYITYQSDKECLNKVAPLSLGSSVVADLCSTGLPTVDNITKWRARGM